VVSALGEQYATLLAWLRATYPNAAAMEERLATVPLEDRIRSIEGYQKQARAEAVEPVEAAPILATKRHPVVTRFHTIDVPKEVPMREVMVERLWPEKASGTLLGPDKSGKTFYALEEALCLATGYKVFGQFATTRRRVLYISEEDTQERLLRRLYDLLGVHGSRDPATELKEIMATGALTFIAGNNIWLYDEPSVTEIERLLCEYAIDVLYLDALGKLTRQQISHDHDAGKLVALFTRLEATGAVLRVVHHTNKAKRHGWTPDTATVRDGSGHHAIADWCRSSLLFSRRNATIVNPKPHEVVDMPSLLRFEGSMGAPAKLGLMVQRHLNTEAPEPVTSHLTGLTFTDDAGIAVVGKPLERGLLAKVIEVLADPATPRTTDSKTGLAGVPTVAVADRAGFGTMGSGRNKAVRYLEAAVTAKKAVRITEGRETETLRGAVLWEKTA
jgi:hypothetical protein